MSVISLYKHFIWVEEGTGEDPWISLSLGKICEKSWFISFRLACPTLRSPESNITAWPFNVLTAKVKRQATGLDIVALSERKTDSRRDKFDMFKMNPLYNVKQVPFLLIEPGHSSFSVIEKCLPVFQMQIAYNINSIRKEICSEQICLVARFAPSNKC